MCVQGNGSLAHRIRLLYRVRAVMREAEGSTNETRGGGNQEECS